MPSATLFSKLNTESKHINAINKTKNMVLQSFCVPVNTQIKKQEQLVGNKCAYQGVRNLRFSENLTCFVFLKHPFSDSPFCLITGKLVLCDVSWSQRNSCFLWAFKATLIMHDFKIYLYLRIHMKIICRRFHIKKAFAF